MVPDEDSRVPEIIGVGIGGMQIADQVALDQPILTIMDINSVGVANSTTMVGCGGAVGVLDQAVLD